MKLIKLIASIALIYVFFIHFTPFIAQFFPNWQTYVDTANENNIDPGALYYTDVPVSLESESKNREAVKNAYGSALGWKPLGQNKPEE